MMPKTKLRLPVGRYSDLGRKAQAIPNDRPISTITTTRRKPVLPLIRKTLLAINERTRSPIASKGESLFCSPPRILLARLGMTDTATIRLSTTEQETGMAISRKSWPASSSINTIGRKIATVVSVLASSAPHTSEAPSKAAWARDFPCWRWRICILNFNSIYRL